LPLSACDTVVTDTPAAAATSLIPIFLAPALTGPEAYDPAVLDMQKRFA
jgi:hypothetical protein